MNLMAIVDANYKFIYADVGSEGRHHESTVFKKSRQLGKQLLLNSSIYQLRGKYELMVPNFH